MELCSDGDDEVCFEGRECPVCAVDDELHYIIDNRENNIDDLQSEVDDLKAKIKNME